MKQQYLSPEAKITQWEDEVFLQTSAEIVTEEANDNVFGWTW